MGILSAVHLKKMKKPMKKPMKKGSSKRKQVLKKVLDYLKSDTFMFASLCSSPFSGLINGEDIPLEGNDQNNLHLFSKIGDYLMADTYMYAPLVSQRDVLVSKGPEKEMDRKRCADVLKGGTDEEAGRKTVNVVSKDHSVDGFPHTMVTRTRLRRETVKYMIYQNC